MAPGRRVLVVGGGLGMGLKVTQYLLGHHGARVVVFGLHIAQELQNVSRNSRLKVIKGDVTSGEARKQLFMTVMEFMGGLDCMVWTVGVMGEIQRLVGMSSETLIRTYDINVFAPILMCQTFLAELRKSRGDIIILSSAVDGRIKYAGWIQYCSTKAALTRFIEVLGHEESDVKVVGVYPGLTRTTMVDGFVDGKYAGIMEDDEVRKFIDWHKNNEIEPPEWCANAVAKMAARSILVEGTSQTRYYHEYDPDFESLPTPKL